MVDIIKRLVDRMAIRLSAAKAVMDQWSAVSSAAVAVPAMSAAGHALMNIATATIDEALDPYAVFMQDLQDRQGPRRVIREAAGSDNSSEYSRVNSYPLFIKDKPLQVHRLLDFMQSQGRIWNTEYVEIHPEDPDLVNMMAKWRDNQLETFHWILDAGSAEVTDGNHPEWKTQVTFSLCPFFEEGACRARIVLRTRAGNEATTWLNFSYAARKDACMSVVQHYGDQAWNTLRVCMSSLSNTGIIKDPYLFSTEVTVNNAYENLVHPGSLAYMPHAIVRRGLVKFFEANGCPIEDSTVGFYTAPGNQYEQVTKALTFLGEPELTESERSGRHAGLEEFESWVRCDSQYQNYVADYYEQELLDDLEEHLGRMIRLRRLDHTSGVFTATIVINDATKTAEIKVWDVSAKVWYKPTNRTCWYIIQAMKERRAAWLEEREAAAQLKAMEGPGA